MISPKFLNLTIKSKPLSRQLLKDLRRFFTKLCHRKIWKAKVKGGFYVIELGSLKDTGLWNIHIHAVMDADYIDQAWISKTWLEITGDSMVVDIRAVRSYFYATWYLSKYVAKPITKDGDVPIAERDRVNAALKGTRLIQRFGNCIKFRPEPKKTVCRKCGAINSYISIEIDIDPSIRHFKGWIPGYVDAQKPLAEALDSFAWWAFESDV